MKPIDGVVTGKDSLRLKGGHTVKWENNWTIGTNVKVLYNFTEMEVEDVLEACHVFEEMDEPEPTEREEEEIPFYFDQDVIDDLCRDEW